MSSQQSTPKRRRVADDEAPGSSTTPFRGALSGLRSWLSPWRGNSSRSAAFGTPDREEQSFHLEAAPHAPSPTASARDASASYERRSQTDQHADGSLVDTDESLYPPLSPLRNSLGPPAGLSSHPTMPVLSSDRQRNWDNNGASSATAFPFTFTSPVNAPSNRSPPSMAIDSPPQAPSIPSTSQSPLSRNYTLLARFFAEKAAEEAGTLGELDNRLTEEEAEGCHLLIEESGQSMRDIRHSVVSRQQDTDEYEVPRRRGPPLRRSWLSPSPSMPLGHSPSLVGSHGRHYDGEPLSPSASEALYSNTCSFLAPQTPGTSAPLSHSTTEPALFARSLIGRDSASSPSNPFLSGRKPAAAQTTRRRHRPLYLGPGMSSSNLAVIAANRRRTAGDNLGSKRFEVSTSAPASHRQHAFSPQVDAAPTSKRQRRDLDTGSESVTNSNVALSFADQVRASSSSNAHNDFSFAASSKAKGYHASPTGRIDLSSNSFREPTASPAKTRTANAVLSILSDPDLARPAPSPTRRVAPSSTKPSSSETVTGSAHTPLNASLPSDAILNPYQASPSLNLGSSSSASTRKSRTADAVEKMKDERRRSTRSRRSVGPAVSTQSGPDSSLSLLDKIERTMPPTSAAKRGTSADQSVAASSSTVPPATPISDAKSAMSTTPTSTPPQKASKAAEDKTAEAKRRLEALSASQTKTGATLTVPSTSSTPSFLYTNAHAPPKPSRLSIAYSANESPGSTGTREDDDDDEDEKQLSAQKILSAQPPTSKKSTDSTHSLATSKSTTAPFSFSTPSSSSSSNNAALTPKDTAPPPFSFNGKVTPTTSTAASPLASGQATASDDKQRTPASFSATQSVLRPASGTGAPNEPSHSSTNPTLGSARQQALAKEVVALPVFDLSVSVSSHSSSQWFARTSTTQQEQDRKKASQMQIADLPKFQLNATPSANGTREAPATVPSVALVQGSPPGNGSFASQPPASTQAAPATEGDDNAASEETAPSASALLGSGEGEEGETTLFEVRAKFWRFTAGKWEDLGVGIARVKRRSDDDSGSRRLLVRNAGNGAVSVNFNLFADFKATQTGQTLSFTGFDAEGKGLPMRCKVKTKESAEEFKEALEQQAQS